ASPAPVGAVGVAEETGPRIVKPRPAGAALEFLLRGEQRLAAAGAEERAGAFLVIERAAARPLGAVLAHDVILLGGQELAPLRVGVGHGILFGVRLRAHGHAPVVMVKCPKGSRCAAKGNRAGRRLAKL